MAAVLAEGETTLRNAACEPHVQDLCRFLVKLGAEIDGIGSNVLRIRGVESLGGGSHRICPEHIEVASFIGLAAVTGSDLTIESAEPDDLLAILPAFEKLGVRVEPKGDAVHVPAGQELVIRDDLGGQIPKIEDGIWPAFPSDLTSIAVVVATQAHGTILFFEKMFENRLFFVDKLVGMGAASSSATRIASSSPGRQSSTASAWRARTFEPAWRCSSRASAPKARQRSGTSRRSTGATSGLTSGCAHSGRGLSESTPDPAAPASASARRSPIRRDRASRPASPSSTTSSA